MMQVAWLMRFQDSSRLNLWSGEVTFTFETIVYLPGHFISIQHAGREVGTPHRRATASFSVVDRSLRAALMQDPGPVPVLIQFISSADKGVTWTLAGGRHLGRLSNPSLTGGVYSIEIETYRGDADRGRPQKWSHERQVARGGGGDLAFEMSGKLASGIEVRWPP